MWDVGHSLFDSMMKLMQYRQKYVSRSTRISFYLAAGCRADPVLSDGNTSRDNGAAERRLGSTFLHALLQRVNSVKCSAESFVNSPLTDASALTEWANFWIFWPCWTRPSTSCCTVPWAVSSALTSSGCSTSTGARPKAPPDSTTHRPNRRPITNQFHRPTNRNSPTSDFVCDHSEPISSPSTL